MAIKLEEKEKKMEVLADLEKMSLMEEISWKQKPRIIWLKEGNNTKFFHKIANSHCSFNTIKSFTKRGIF